MNLECWNCGNTLGTNQECTVCKSVDTKDTGTADIQEDMFASGVNSIQPDIGWKTDMQVGTGPKPPCDGKTGSQLRDEGIKQAIDHAEEENENWKEQAHTLFLAWLVMIPASKPFTCEDFREWASEQGLPEPPTNRAFGGIIRQYAHRKVIIKNGFTTHRAANCHVGNTQLWTRAV